MDKRIKNVPRCVFCVYDNAKELTGHDRGKIKSVIAGLPTPTRTVQTPNGPRDLCEGHARLHEAQALA